MSEPVREINARFSCSHICFETKQWSAYNRSANLGIERTGFGKAYIHGYGKDHIHRCGEGNGIVVQPCLAAMLTAIESAVGHQPY